ncbi:SDR family oxidoreductase [Thiothrix lacustris]|uniref:SDR family oxidoreductase n=1 Tax=Thiothrix lacustris TaxID=525917 RepID=UPI0027E4BE45|nr:SDR family oxidoreductase [Thiothrix lacustris]WMP16233.1 SDR family oxidoreductase [Thiothrix lacustris]
MARFDEILVGQVAELEHVVTEKDLERFVELSGDDNRLHVDADYAARTSFKKPVAHGMLGVSFISTIIGTRLPGDGALWFSQSLEFLLPVRVGDTLLVRAEVLSKADRTQVIELQTDIFNQNRQKVTTGIAKVKVVEFEEDVSIEPEPPRPVALVVGGSGGMGSAVCRSLAAAGFDVAVHGFTQMDKAAAIAREVETAGQKTVIVSADIRDEAAVANMVHHVKRHLGNITVLVNCTTASMAPIRWTDVLWKDFDAHLQTALQGAFHLVRHVTPQMEAVGYGKIIHISAQMLDTPMGNQLPFIAAKAALEGFSHALAIELASSGIRVNMVAPGMTDTAQMSEVPERIRLMAAARVPLRRLAKPDDIAGVVTFLASRQSDYLTGETIRVNGGQVMS